MTTFWLSAALGDATIKAMVSSKHIDNLVSDWETRVKATDAGPDADMRHWSREFIVTSLLSNEHHSDEKIRALVSEALLWLVVDGPVGKSVLPLLRRGGPNMKVHQEITQVSGGAYNIRTTFDEETSKILGIPGN